MVDLCSEEGINASSLSEAYGCIFGRDSAITILKILKVHTHVPNQKLLDICKQTLLTLVALQGQKQNIENGEEDGKFIHEYRKNHKIFNANRKTPWFVQEDGTIKNYDSVDSTPLTLLALYRYWEVTQDDTFLLRVLPSVTKGLRWIRARLAKDAFLAYEFPKTRLYGGLKVQSWTDSVDSLLTKDGVLPPYPIAPIEVQAYVWLTLVEWNHVYMTQDNAFAVQLLSSAKQLKKKFNQAFLIKSKNLFYGVQALDGNKHQIPTITGNPLICLWATTRKKECILEEAYIADFVKRGLQDDLFEPDAGIRTMSTLSATFNPLPTSYHNGSFWPILNSLIYEGLITWNFQQEAAILKQASLSPIQYFGCPIELYIKGVDGSFLEYKSPFGKSGCRFQAWTAAALFEWAHS
ncbi:MAG TPA: amylo-alpha-1,6-glucosidase [Patescibacteria group bacterium]|nr:amylo-alpha-1,6-glucosidase [Patescibacteria group bacterium]